MRGDGQGVLPRLTSAQGHLAAVARMVAEDRYCIDVLHQLSAVQGALDRVRRQILETHLRSCVPDAMAEGRVDQVVEELVAASFGATQPCRHHEGGRRCSSEKAHR
jgi:CsoR family transcriptional regulator, copper-sensing transcriptional repressor